MKKEVQFTQSLKTYITIYGKILKKTFSKPFHFYFSPTVNYVLGSGENVHIDVKVENSGEDAFEAAYYLQIPAGVTYAKMERLDKDNAEASPIYCSIKNKGTSGNSTLKCDLGNPLASGQNVSVYK